MDSASLQIVISAVDEASASLGAITDQLKEMGSISDSVSTQMSDGANASAASLDRLTATVAETGASMEALAVKTDASVVATDANTAAQAKQAEALLASGGAAEKNTASVGKMGVGTVAAAAVVGYAIDKTVKSYANLQTGMTKLVTSAGESSKNLAMVTAGVQNIAKVTGTSTTDLGNAMYYVESGGFHAAAGLKVMMAAAKGAKDEQASALSVADATTTILNDYGMGANKATQAVNGMIASVSRGKTTLQLFSTSLSNVLPTAHALGISFAQVGGAIATMTAQGMTAKRASQDLNHAISSLANPTTVQTNMMLQMGLNSQTVAHNLGKEGLTGTIQELSDAIQQHMAKSGMVLQTALMNPMEAAQDAKQAIAALPGPVAALAQQLEAGSISWTAYREDIRSLSPTMENLGANFESTYLKTSTLNTQIKAGVPSAMTYNAVMAKMTGGQNGLQVALMLGGSHAKTFGDNVNAVSKAMDTSTQKIIGWSNVQGTFNQQWSQLREDLVVFGQQVGKALIPMLTMIAKTLALIFAPLAELITKFPVLSAVLLALVGTFLTFLSVAILSAKSINLIKSSFETLATTFPRITGLVTQLTAKLFGLDSASVATKASMGEVGASIGGIAPEAEAGTAALGEEGGAGLLGSMSLLGPVGIAAGVAAVGATYLIATHWNTVKSTVDGAVNSVKNFLGLGGTSKVNLNAPTQTQSKTTVTDDSKQLIASQRQLVSITQQLTKLDGQLATAHANVTTATSKYRNALIDEANAYIKGGAGSKIYKDALATAEKAQEGVTAATSKLNKLNVEATSLSSKLTAAQKAQVDSTKGLSAALSLTATADSKVNSAHKNLVQAQNTAAMSAKNLATTIGTMNQGPLKDSPFAINAIQKAQNEMLSSTANVNQATQTYNASLKNQSAAQKDVSMWTANGDAAIKALGLGHAETTALIKQLNSQVNDSSSKLKSAKSDANSHTIALKNLKQAHTDASSKVLDFNNKVNDSATKLTTAKSKADDAAGGINNVGSAFNNALGPVNNFNAALGNVNKSLSTAQSSPLMAGIPKHASGITNSPGGLALVGEAGPELVNLPAGSSVMTASQTAQVIANGQPTTSGTGAGTSGGSSPITLNVQFTGPVMGNSSQAQQFATQIWQSLQQISRQYGNASALPNIGIRPI